jgi:hypothetical protein
LGKKLPVVMTNDHASGGQALVDGSSEVKRQSLLFFNSLICEQEQKALLEKQKQQLEEQQRRLEMQLQAKLPLPHLPV